MSLVWDGPVGCACRAPAKSGRTQIAPGCDNLAVSCQHKAMTLNFQHDNDTTTCVFGSSSRAPDGVTIGEACMGQIWAICA